MNGPVSGPESGMTDATLSVSELVRRAAERFAAAGIDFRRAGRRLPMGFALGIDRVGVLAHGAAPVPGGAAAAFEGLVARRDSVSPWPTSAASASSTARPSPRTPGADPAARDGTPRGRGDRRGDRPAHGRAVARGRRAAARRRRRDGVGGDRRGTHRGAAQTAHGRARDGHRG